MRENPEYIASNEALIMVLEHTMPAARKRDVGSAEYVGQHAAQAVAETQHIEHRVGEIAEHRRDGELAPYQYVAAPDVDEAPEGRPEAATRDLVHRLLHSLLSVAQIAAGQPQEYIFQIRRPVQVTQLGPSLEIAH